MRGSHPRRGRRLTGMIRTTIGLIPTPVVG
jgi:hypothetical protein